uniref:hypothetical chloroplast RF47 n=1 Tax=Massjukichlorella minus TaxID=2650457 RepID=UPI002410D4E3|nr:hypothetical chloroplast RF47 [Massjukichlorella minus]WDY12993.1 hypothetical chloroplast RF47 [Massjukichlorella minus]
MIMIFRLFVTLILIAFITPQTSIVYYNFVIIYVHSLNLFLYYSQAKLFVISFTWICIFLYLLLNFVATY